MNKPFNAISYFVVLLPLMLAGSMLTLYACRSLEQASEIGNMDDAQFANWSKSTAQIIAQFVKAAVDEGDISPEQPKKWAAELYQLADKGNSGSLVEWVLSLDLQGYKGLVALIALQEFSNQLEKLDAYLPDGQMASRGIVAITTLAWYLENEVE